MVAQPSQKIPVTFLYATKSILGILNKGQPTFITKPIVPCGHNVGGIRRVPQI
ncbi:MAG: hypothetical protein ACE5OZ_18915 [Candidatus Heimdallarchaeota archaeon]